MLRSAFGKIKTKLKSNTGASLMVALLFFIMCAVVGSVIIAAASSAAGRMAGNRTAAQNQYALRSAEKLVKEQIESAEYVNNSVKDTKFVDDDNTNSRKYRDFALGTNTGTGAEKAELQMVDITNDSVPSDIAGVVGIMADKFYQASWEDANGIQSKWPASDETVMETGGTVSDSRSDISWGSGDDKTEMLTLELSETNGTNRDQYKAFNVDVEMTMHNDFSMDIVLKLSASNNDKTPDNNPHSGIIMKATPFVNLQYNSVKSGEESESDDISKNQQIISCDITWSVVTANEIQD